MLAYKLGLKTGLIQDSEKILSDLKKLPDEIQKILSIDYEKLAKKIYKKHDIFFIGRLLDYYLSEEGSLKLKEISYLHSETYPAGELKHGTISLIEDKTPVIAVLTDESIYEKTISNIKEVKARGAYTIGIKRESLEVEENIFDDVIEIANLNDLAISPLAIVPLQMLAYTVANLLGYDIDKPRNLAKSVTVE